MPVIRSSRRPGSKRSSHALSAITKQKNRTRNAHPAGQAIVPADTNRIAPKTTAIPAILKLRPMIKRSNEPDRPGAHGPDASPILSQPERDDRIPPSDSSSAPHGGALHGCLFGATTAPTAATRTSAAKIFIPPSSPQSGRLLPPVARAEGRPTKLHPRARPPPRQASARQAGSHRTARRSARARPRRSARDRRRRRRRAGD